MIWFIIGMIVLIMIGKFVLALNKDNRELENLNLADKFQFLVDELNKRAFDSEANVHMRDKRSFYLHLKGGNQIVEFFYSTGHLTVQWKFTFTVFGNEVVFERQINDVRNLEERSQIALANSILHDVENLFRSKVPDAVPFYSHINKSGFLFKESHAILSELKGLILGDIPYYDGEDEEEDYEEGYDGSMDYEDSENETDEYQHLFHKVILHDSNGEIINTKGYKLYHKTAPLINLLTNTLRGNCTIELTQNGSVVLYRVDLREKIEFISKGDDLQLIWKYKHKSYGEQVYNLTIEGIMSEERYSVVKLIKLHTDIVLRADIELNKYSDDDYLSKFK
ncbi:MAG TPA: hypothetical protein VKX29_02570 [Brumimicrobium sp.]|nr:hypothetical protein [Brumimicrobium sp.]